MKRVVEICGGVRHFDLIRADGHALNTLLEFFLFSTNDRGYFVREGGEYIGLVFYGYDRNVWIVSTDTVLGGFDEPHLQVRTLTESCKELWNRREARVSRWRDEVEIAAAVCP